MKKVDLPYPSLVIDSPELEVKPGAKVIITLRDEKKLLGLITHFVPDQPTIGISCDGKEITVDVSKIKILNLPEDRVWRPEKHPLQGAEGVDLHHESQPFEVVFTDGSKVAGKTLGYRPDQYGLHLFPATGSDRFIQAFVPHQAIESYRVGEFLGELLIKDNLVTERDLKLAMDTQSEQRSQPLGDYLLSHSVVSSEDLSKALTRQRSMPNMRLGEILVSEGLVTEAQIDEALGAQASDRSRPLGEILVDQGVVSQADIQRGLAKKLGIPFIDLEKYQIPPDIIGKVSSEIAESLQVVPVSLYEGRLVVAMQNPMDREAMEQIRFNSNLTVEPVMADPMGISKAIEFYYSIGSDESLEELEEAHDEEADLNQAADERDNGLADNLVVKVVNKIITDAYKRGVSDIHIEPYPGKGKTVVRFRKDGSLIEYVKLPGQYRTALVARIKVMAQLDISERRRPQDGKIDFKKFGPLRIELRVATVPTAAGLEDVVMRILAAGKPVPIDKLALSERNLTVVQNIVSKPYGMIFVCGPTGSGKTTTLHSILGYINTPERKIWTAEDPVEITQEGLRQVHINPKAGLTFADAMRSFLRADPDVIMVGEMRDKETTSIGIEASLTGHLVLSTLHTNSAPESITRLLDMGMDPFNFSDALLGVLAQRLAKRLCAECKEAYHPEEPELNSLLNEYCEDVAPDQREDFKQQVTSQWKKTYADEQGKFTLHRAKGCSHCDDTGYAGRIGLHEVLVASDDIKRAIITRMPIIELTKIAILEGMRTLRQDGIEKVLEGHTDMSRVRAVCIK